MFVMSSRSCHKQCAFSGCRQQLVVELGYTPLGLEFDRKPQPELVLHVLANPLSEFGLFGWQVLEHRIVVRNAYSSHILSGGAERSILSGATADILNCFRSSSFGLTAPDPPGKQRDQKQ